MNQSLGYVDPAIQADWDRLVVQAENTGKDIKSVTIWTPIALFAGLSVIGVAVYLSRK